MTHPAHELRLALDAELWVIEALLFSARRDDLADALAEHGLSRDEARAQVARIERSPGYQRLASRLSEARFAARLLALERALIPPDREIPTAAAIDAEALLTRHWIPSRPLQLPGWGASIAASRWTFAGLRARFGSVPVALNVGRERAASPADVERYEAERPFAEVIDRALGAPGDDSYVVSRNGLLANPGLRALWDDLLELPAPLVRPDPPRGVAMWLGPAGTHTRPHFDPHNVMLVQVCGEKEVRLAPRPGPSDHARFDGYTLRGPVDALNPHVIRLGPGDALFVPAGWVHDVRATSPSITLSFLCFPWPNHFHFLGPTGSDDGD